MKKAIKFLSFALCFALIFCTGCNKGGGGETGGSPESIIINNTQTTVGAGSFDIDAVVKPSGADQRINITILGSPAGITVEGKTITVSPMAEDGLKFTVKVTSLLDLTISATMQFTVNNPPLPPKEISNAEEFSAIRNDLNANYVLTADIDLGGAAWDPIGTADMEDNSGHIVSVGVGFAGKLDGNGYTVKNFRYENDEAEVVGLFGQIEKTGIVERLALSGTLKGSKWCGGLVGINHGTIRNCFIDVEVTGTSFPMSAVAGNNKGKVQNTVAIGKVTCPDGKDGAAFVGSTDGSVTNSFAHKGNIPYAYGWAKTPSASISKSENELKTAATYSKWDKEIWYVADGIYPILKYDGFVPPVAEVLVNVTNTEKSLNLRADPAENSLQIEYSVINAENKNVTFSLKSPVSGATLSSSGLLTLDNTVADNSLVTVVVTSEQDSSKFAEYTVKINNFDPQTEIELATYDDILSHLINTFDETDLTKNYALTADIDLTGKLWNAMIGSGTEGEGVFVGTFNGRGHKISGIEGGSAAANFGLFKRIGKNGTVKNLEVVTGGRGIYGGNDSALFASVNDGTIENVIVSGEVMGTGTNVAGFVCQNNGTIRNSVSLVKVFMSESQTAATSNAIAKTNEGTIENVFVDGEVTGATRVLLAASDLDALIKTTAQMKTAETFKSFDSEIWQITADNYPSLKKA